ncbi:MAG: hypothetical protein ACXADY_08055 [Candidatus Hodarchaeales archaeon]
MKKFLNRLLSHFKKPDQKNIEKILTNIGITQLDTNYENLKMNLSSLIEKKAKETHFNQFFEQLTNLLYHKISDELSKRDKLLKIQDDRLQELREELMKDRKQLVNEIVENILTPQVFTIIDLPIYKVLQLLKEGVVCYKSLQKKLNLKNSELMWRLHYLKDLGLVLLHYHNNSTICQLSDTSRSLLNKKEGEYNKMLDLLVHDKTNQLALKAVAGDYLMAKTFMNWLKSDRGRAHMGKINKLSKEFDDPKKVSQCFFRVREMGTTHEKHIGVRICDHQASGELLLSELHNYHLNHRITAKNRSTFSQQEIIKISN